MYSVADYGSMIADRVRMDAYEAALKAAIRPGAVVLDIGAGTGICALLACRYGARHVYALEVNPAVVVGRTIAEANGLAERITFVRQLSTSWQPPEQADVMVSDLRGVLPLTSGHLPAIIDARTRLLKSGGIQIPRRDDLWAAVVRARRVHDHLTRIWTDNPYGLDMSAARELVVNTWLSAPNRGCQPITAPAHGATLDYTTLDNTALRAHFTWHGPGRGRAHGILVWFEAEVLEGIRYTTAPDQPPTVYGRAFVPWPHAVALDGSETIELELCADLVGDDYIWRWETTIARARGDGAPATRFKQSTFHSQPLDLDRLHRRAPGHVPSLGVEGRIDLLILQGMAEGLSVQALAERLAVQLPDRFPGWQAALGRVGDVAARYDAGAVERSGPAAS